MSRELGDRPVFSVNEVRAAIENATSYHKDRETIRRMIGRELIAILEANQLRGEIKMEVYREIIERERSSGEVQK